MVSTRACQLGGLIVVALSIGVQAAIHPLPTPQRRLMPVNTFPNVLGSWRAGNDLAQNPEVLEVCPTANIVERPYTNDRGQQIDVLLLTATAAGDIHDPQVCFPSQGWKTYAVMPFRVGGKTVQKMIAAQNGSNLKVYYWFDGYQQPRLSSSPIVQKASQIRTKIVGKMDGMSLFVRVIAPDTISDKDMELFLKQAIVPIDKMVSA